MNNKNTSNTRKWLALINIPIQMGIVIFLFAYAGKWLDEKYNSNVYTKILVVVGVLIAIYNVNRQLKELNKS